MTMNLTPPVSAFARLFVLAVACAFGPGCGEVEDGPAVHPVVGSILVDGKPASGAEVVFHPVARLPAGTPPPMAVADADGRFRPSTRLANDGAPAGDYVLTVVHRKPTKLADDDGGSAVDQLKGRYGDPRKSPLKATVKAGDNVLDPIEINTKAKR